MLLPRSSYGGVPYLILTMSNSSAMSLKHQNRLALTSLLKFTHALAHPGGNASLRDLQCRFVWRGMASQIKNFCRSCLHCQHSNVYRHTKAPPTALEMPDQWFDAIHLDLVGPLHEAEGCSYLLTFIDRFSRWMASITAETCASALLHHWASRLRLSLTEVSNLPLDCGRSSLGCSAYLTISPFFSWVFLSLPLVLSLPRLPLPLICTAS